MKDSTRMKNNYDVDKRRSYDGVSNWCWVLCEENILEKTLSELHEEGCTDIKLIDAQEAQ